MKLSIILTSYNQEKYIFQAMEGLFLQSLDGMPAELIIADDCSTDNTLQIIRQFVVRDGPFLVRELISQGNLGLVRNYERAFKACTGEYIAILEGDDYWTDSNRLIKLVRFLDQNPSFSLIMNRYKIYNEISGNYHIPKWDSANEFQTISTSQMAELNRLGNLSACVLRKRFFDQLKPDIFDMYIADWMIGLAISEYGPIAIGKEIMSVYRVHEKSEWAKMSLYEQVKNTLPLLDVYNDYLGKRYDSEFLKLKKRMLEYKEEFEKGGDIL
jgi:glycosyltransferase involved in cell wall biosynthesis